MQPYSGHGPKHVSMPAIHMLYIKAVFFYISFPGYVFFLQIFIILNIFLGFFKNFQVFKNLFVILFFHAIFILKMIKDLLRDI